MDQASTEYDGRKHRRPLGIWMLTGAHCASAIFGLYLLYFLFGMDSSNGGDFKTAWSMGTAPYLIAMLALMIVSSIAAFFGSRHGRMGLLILLSLWAALFGYETCLELIGMLHEWPDTTSKWLWTGGFWRFVAWPIGVLSWAVLNSCYFFGNRTRAFYAADAD